MQKYTKTSNYLFLHNLNHQMHLLFRMHLLVDLVDAALEDVHETLLFCFHNCYVFRVKHHFTLQK